MKKVYQCSCGKIYEDQFDCIRCEQGHWEGKTVPVIEVFLAGQTTYENPRDYFMFKKTYLLNEKQLEAVKSITKDNSMDFFYEVLCEEIVRDRNFEENFETAFYCFDPKDDDKDGDQIRITDKDEYSYADEDKDRFYMEVDLYSKYIQKGEMSVFYMTAFELNKNDVNHQDNIDVYAKRTYTDNR